MAIISKAKIKAEVLKVARELRDETMPKVVKSSLDCFARVNRANSVLNLFKLDRDSFDTLIDLYKEGCQEAVGSSFLIVDKNDLSSFDPKNLNQLRQVGLLSYNQNGDASLDISLDKMLSFLEKKTDSMKRPGYYYGIAPLLPYIYVLHRTKG